MNWRRFLRTSPALSGYALFLGAAVINILVQGPSFFSLANINSVLCINAPLIIAAMAQTIIVLAGGIDLSIGSNITFVNAVAIVLANQYHWPIGGSWVAALAAGTLVGMLNGIVVAYIRIPPLLATFATMSVFGGMALWILPKPGGSVPQEVYSTYSGYLLGIPTTMYVITAVVLIWVMVSKFPMGKYLRAVGGNERSAYASGIRTERVRFFAYALGGFLTAVAGLCLTALTASGDPKIGSPFTLNSIAAIILGGTILTGGWGSIGGSIAGSLFLALVGNIVFFAFNNFLSLIPSLNVSTYYQQLLSNFIVVFGLASAVLTNRREKSSKLGKLTERRNAA